MKQWKTYKIVIFVLMCVSINTVGRMAAALWNLPLWLDTVGTMMCAYVGGPVCGCIVGFCSNMIYGIFRHISFAYSLVSAGIGVLVGIAAKKGLMKSFSGMMMIGGWCAALSIFISVPLNIMFNSGLTGNMWGDGVVHYMQERGLPKALCLIAGQSYVDFLDKVLSILLVFIILNLYTFLSFRKNLHAAGAEPNEDAAMEALLEAEEKLAKEEMLLVLALAAAGSLALFPVKTEAKPQISYGDYVQTIYSSSNGLPCGEANDIEQTKDGILWIGTYAGLYRYNGSEFKWMDEYDSVRNVNCLYVDPEGRLWIGTNDNGLSIAINEKIVNVVDEDGGLPSNSVRCIIQSADGYYYIGTTGSMQILSLSSGLKSINTLWEVNYADDISADGMGNVSTVTSDGRLFLLNGGQIKSSLRVEGGDEVFCCCEFDGDGLLLAGTTRNTVYVYDVSEGYFNEVSSFSCEDLISLNDLHFMESGEMFIAADNGIGYMDADHVFHSVNTNEFNNSIDNMLVDYQGNLWYTSSRLGLLRLSASPFRDIYSTAGISSKVVRNVRPYCSKDYRHIELS